VSENYEFLFKLSDIYHKEAELEKLQDYWILSGGFDKLQLN
jgi:hypothetical protein